MSVEGGSAEDTATQVWRNQADLPQGAGEVLGHHPWVIFGRHRFGRVLPFGPMYPSECYLFGVLVVCLRFLGQLKHMYQINPHISVTGPSGSCFLAKVQ